MNELELVAAKCVALENFCAEVASVFENMGDSTINKARLKRIDAEMNCDPKAILAARDARVARAGFMAGVAFIDDIGEFRSEENTIAHADIYAAKIRGE